MEVDRSLRKRRCPSVPDMDKMIWVEYEEESDSFFRDFSIVVILILIERRRDSPNDLFWILTPDDDVYPEILQVPSATDMIWPNEWTILFWREWCPLVVAWSEFTNSELLNVFRSLLKSSVRATLRSLRDGGHVQSERVFRTVWDHVSSNITRHSSGRRIDEGDFLNPDENGVDPLLDACVLSVQRNSLDDRHRGVSQRCVWVDSISLDWMIEFRPGFLTTKRHIFEWTFLCILWLNIQDLRNSVLYSLRTLLRKDISYFVARLWLEWSLISFRVQSSHGLSCWRDDYRCSRWNFRDKVIDSLFGYPIEDDSHSFLGIEQTRGLLMIASELGGVYFRCADKGDSSCPGVAESPRDQRSDTSVRRRQEEMFISDEKGLDVLLADSVQQDNRSVSRELLH